MKRSVSTWYRNMRLRSAYVPLLFPTPLSFPSPARSHLSIPKRRTCSYDTVRGWCRENFLSHPTLERLDNLREQFRQQLAEVGFTSAAVPSARAAGRDAAARGVGSNWRRGEDPTGGEMAQSEGHAESGLQDPDRNAGNIALVQSVLVAGLYPHVAAFMRPDPQRKVRLK